MKQILFCVPSNFSHFSFLCAQHCICCSLHLHSAAPHAGTDLWEVGKLKGLDPNLFWLCNHNIKLTPPSTCYYTILWGGILLRYFLLRYKLSISSLRLTQINEYLLQISDDKFGGGSFLRGAQEQLEMPAKKPIQRNSGFQFSVEVRIEKRESSQFRNYISSSDSSVTTYCI